MADSVMIPGSADIAMHNSYRTCEIPKPNAHCSAEGQGRDLALRRAPDPGADFRS